jgi:hypothetical protein
MELIDAPNREQTGKIVVSALYHRNSLPQGSGDAILVDSWISWRKVGAGDGNRTHDIQLGKLTFYL